MFSDKLKYYDKPCKWLKFLLNIWWPFVILLTGSTVIDCMLSWSPERSSEFVWCLISCVTLLVVDLMARFLDKTAFVSLLFALAVRGAFWIESLVSQLGFIGYTDDPLSNVTVSVFNGVLVIVDGMIIALIIATILSAVYIVKRKNLFM